MKTNSYLTAYKIIQSFAGIQDAFDSVKPDTAYNPALAVRHVKDIAKDGSGRAWLLENGQIVYELKTRDGLRLLHRFEPFHGCLSDSAFSLAYLCENCFRVSEPCVRNDKAGRKAIANICAAQLAVFAADLANFS